MHKLLRQLLRKLTVNVKVNKGYAALLLIALSVLTTSAFAQAPPAAPPPLPNLSFHKPAYQSSTIYGGDASRAVDGNTDSTFSHGSVSLTDYEANAWWMVDLGDQYEIHGVALYARTDWGLDQLSYFVIAGLSDDGYWYPIIDLSKYCLLACGAILAPGKWDLRGPNPVITFDVTVDTRLTHAFPKTRYVLIQKVYPGYMQLAEVEVY